MSQENEKTQIRQAILQAKQGDDEAFRWLLEQYKPLLSSVVSSFATESVTGADREDLYQDAVISFHQAVLHYDMERVEVEFGLYAKICITNALKSSVRRLQRQVALSVQEEWEMTEVGASVNPVDSLLEEERFICLDKQIRSCLSPLEYRIWQLRYVGKTPMEIGAIVGKDEKSVHNAVYRIRKKLRASIHDNE